jgi:hypothetical protein
MLRNTYVACLVMYHTIGQNNKFHFHTFRISLVIDIKLKATVHFPTAAMFYSVFTKIVT